MKLPPNIEAEIEALHLACIIGGAGHESTFTPPLLRDLNHIAELVSEDCAKRIEEHQIARDGVKFHLWNTLMRRLAFDVRIRYGLDKP